MRHSNAPRKAIYKKHTAAEDQSGRRACRNYLILSEKASSVQEGGELREDDLFSLLQSQRQTYSLMPFHKAENFIIVGVTAGGQQFRPSDWAERLCGVMSAFGSGRRMTYSPHVQPGTHEGYKCVFVDAGIYAIEPMAYSFLVNFAKDNQLKVVPWARISADT